MPRNILPALGATTDAEVHVIEANGVYSVAAAQRVLHLRKSTIRRELRQGRLRVSKRAGRYFLLGRWLIEWLEGGELKRGVRDEGA